MSRQYQARRVSRPRAEALRKQGRLHGAILLDLFNGFVLVEPSGAELGDGPVLSPVEAGFELQDAWHLGPPETLRHARALLGLPEGRPVAAGA
jgi:hypothetical protein